MCCESSISYPPLESLTALYNLINQLGLLLAGVLLQWKLAVSMQIKEILTQRTRITDDAASVYQ